MPFIPHTEDDVASMLATVGVADLAALFDEIPEALAAPALARLSEPLSEMQVMQRMQARAQADSGWSNFIGAGAYEHHIPAAIWQIVGRGEFYTAYTPYQAEASQGTLQLLYEWQSMMCALTGLDVSNASLYDGASALAEAILMAVRLAPERRRVLLPRSVHPLYRRAAAAIVGVQGIELVELPYCTEHGNTPAAMLAGRLDDSVAALVVPLPNFFGVLEDVHALTDAAHAAGVRVIALCNPLALALMSAPGTWGSDGADICCGEAQPFGLPLAGGGPYLGYLTAKKALARQMPGRIVGRTVDLDGRTGYTLTLQAREQHIRRAKATSNICTNQGLMVTAATLYLALTGATGLAHVASRSAANCRRLVAGVCALPGVGQRFAGPYFHECVLALPESAERVLARMREAGILAGHDLAEDYPELGPAILACATETKSAEDLAAYAAALAAALH